MSVCSFSFYLSIFITNSPISVFAYMWISTRCSSITFGASDTNFSLFSSIGSVHISSTSCFCSFPNVFAIFSVWWCIASVSIISIIPSDWFISSCSHNCKTNNTIFFFNRLGISNNCNFWVSTIDASGYFKVAANRQTFTT